MSLITNEIEPSYISKPFGKYTVEVCSKTKYFNALHILKVYNDTYEKQHTMTKMIRYIGRTMFMKQVVSDFNHIVDKNTLDYEYLNNLINNIDDPKLGSSTKSSKTYVEDKSDGDKLSPSTKSLETSVEDFKTLSRDIKYQYMIRKEESGYNKISKLDIHPMSAIGLAMWLSPNFGSEVKDLFLRYIDCDITLVKDVIENINKTSDKIHNFVSAIDPDTNEATILVTTFEKNNYMAKIKNDRLKKHIQQLIDEKDGIITKQVDVIDKLRSEIRENEKQRQIDMKKQSDEIQKLLGYAKDTKSTLDETKEQNTTLVNKIDKQSEQLVLISQDRVLLSELTNPKHNIIVIKWQARCSDQYPFCVFNCQKRSLNKLIKEQRLKMNCSFKQGNLYENYQPNAKAFWNAFIEKHGRNLLKFKNTSWFGFNNISPDEFVMKLHELEEHRIEV